MKATKKLNKELDALRAAREAVDALVQEKHKQLLAVENEELKEYVGKHYLRTSADSAFRMCFCCTNVSSIGKLEGYMLTYNPGVGTHTIDYDARTSEYYLNDYKFVLADRTAWNDTFALITQPRV